MKDSISSEMKVKMFDKLPGMVYQCIYNPPNLPFSFVSDGCYELTGYTAEELTATYGPSLLDVVHPSDTQALNLVHNATLAIGAPMETSFRILTKSGDEKMILARAGVVQTDSEGMPYLIEGLLVDISKQLLIQSKALENRKDTDLWSRMGYGIRTPMNTIMGVTELGMTDNVSQSVIRDYIRTIKKAGEKLMTIFNDIVDYSSIRNGELVISAGEYTLSSFVYSVINAVKSQIFGTNLEFIVYMDNRLPNVLIGDAPRLRQILLSVLFNAVKFTDKGYVSLSVEGDTREDGTMDLRVSIEDTGRGIKEEDIHRLFLDFTQFDSKTIEGTGLGLTIANDLIKMMDGSIDVSSAFGLGSVFTITVPQVYKVPPQQDDATATDAPAQNMLSVCPPIKIDNNKAIVFIDSKSVRTSLIRTLKNLGMPYEAIAGCDELHTVLKSGEYTYLFITSDHMSEFRNENPDFKIEAKIVLISDYEESTVEYSEILTKPVFCLPIADMLNNDSPDGGRNHYSTFAWVPIRFTAPGARVLVVDDISANLAVAEGFLSPYRMSLDLCESGEDALLAVRANQYDLVLMDHLMPVMTGAETTERIRRLDDEAKTDCANVPIIALTANTMYSSSDVFRQHGYDDFLPKPIDPYRLNDIIEKWIPISKQRKTTGPIVQGGPANVEPDFEIDGIDVKRGIMTTGCSLEMYMKVIEKYYRNCEKLLVDLKTASDAKAFMFCYHALNSLSESIGAAEIAKDANLLEIAAERGDMSFIHEHNPQFIVKLETIIRNMNRALFQESEEEAADTQDSISEDVKKKVLIIDDTDAYLLILNEMLKDDFEILVALDGRDGLNTTRLTMPDLILMDVVMPGLTGYDVLEMLKADASVSSIPVILMSGKRSKKNEDKGYALGAADYITKPFEKGAVKEKIEKIFNANATKNRRIF